MSTAEHPLPTSQEVASFRMPMPEIGQTVRFFRDGRRTGSPPLISVVTKVSRSNRNLSVQPLVGRENFSGVRHVDDPKLTGNQEMQKLGAWDFCEEHYEIQRLSDQVCRLTEELEKLKSAKRGPGRPRKDES